MDILRFEVVICGLNDGERSVYTAASLHGAYKAVAMAASAHAVKPEHHRIYKVEVRELPGRSPSSNDLVDRMEW
ncbi:hypothetical protein [Marinobacter adhaerens]|jgi:hypothetical protein|uniref:hypothetical protein n=1 Tax=Marinobacter adhaerens TaxID=1033846 RepID=UPI001E36F05A|nr:hypothetical protein [Marinobacter adhaerens]MCD1647734.1 hypothetical protein [Marinobacter adhaerens]